MPLTSTLEALNGLANVGAKSPLVPLWKQLRVDFIAKHDQVVDRKAPKFAFEEWALDNVHEKVLAWATNDIYIDGNTTLKQDVLRRWKPSLEHLSTSLGVLAFLFGTEVVGSRSCCEALCNLCRTTPMLTLGALFARFVEEQRHEVNRSRTRSPNFVFKNAMQSFSSEHTRKRSQTRKNVQTGAGPDVGGGNAENTRRVRQNTSESPERARREQQQYAQSNMSDISSGDGIEYKNRFSPPPADPHLSPGPLFPGLASIENPQRKSVVGSAIDEYGEVAPGDGHAELEFVDGSFHFAVRDSKEIAKEHIADGSEKPTDVSLLPPSPSSRMTPSPMLSPEPLRDLSTIEEEPASPCHTGSHVLVTRGSFSRRKRSLSMSEVLEASDHEDLFAPPPKVVRRQHTALRRPLTTPSTQMPTRAGARIDEIIDSMYRLNDGHFLNDVIVNTMAHRLASEGVGVIDSLTIASKIRTSNFRAKIQTTMSRGQVLIFVNHNFHWMLYVWTPTKQMLQEFNSMPEPGGRFAGCCDTVTDFVKWAHGNPAMAIHLERPACAEQQNGWDCRVFTIRFAECLARGQAIPHAIDGSLERKCLTNSILVTWAGALHPEEISNIGCPLAESPADKRRQFLNYFQRKRSFHQLLSVGGCEYATSHAFTTNLRQMAESEDDAIQKSVLASMIASIRAVHRKSLEIALSAATQATALLEKSRQWTNVKNKMVDLLSTLAEMGSPGDLAALPAPDQSRHRNLEIIRNAGQNMQNDWELCQGNYQSAREAREEAEARFSMTRVQLLILYHAVRKFRQDDANIGTA